VSPAAPDTASEQLSIDIPAAARRPKTQLITRSQIYPDPDQPRKAADAELRNSIARNGMLQPITVRPHPERLGDWMIVDGERRWRSAEGVLEDLVCIVRQDQEDDARRLATQLEANTGKPLTPLEEAHAFLRIAQSTGMTPAEIAEFTGRPKSTVAERLGLLDLGPWVPLIESGEIVMSHAVRVLLPLRTAADSAHEHAIAFMQKDYRYQHKGGGAGISLGDFERLMNQAYRPAMYPLTKTKTRYHKQPEFNTSKHDAECDCGGIMYALDNSDTKRRCCGNPAWWRPLHRKALAAKKPAADKPAKRTKTLCLPPAVKAVKSQYGQTPSGVTQLTDSNGAWAFDRFNGDKAFDPADLAIDDAKLVTWPSGWGDGYPIVGTRDAGAVAAARAQWAERWQAERVKLVERLREDLTMQMPGYRVTGGALAAIGAQLNEQGLALALEIAQALGLEIPASVTRGERWNQSARTARWIATLPADGASDLLTAIATFLELRMTSPNRRIAERQEAALAAIAKREIPWKTKPKGTPAVKKAADSKKGKKGAKAKRADKEVPLGKLSEDTAEMFDDDEEDAGWASHADDSDDPWDDAGDEELEEAEA
jgi:ParB/RepB/Spo0J family partition protein